MTCIAKATNKRTDKSGNTWSKEWALFDGGREFGIMVWNKHWDKPFQVMFHSPLGKNFGITGVMECTDVNKALAYAKENKDQNKTYTMAMVEHQLETLREYRYQEETSNDLFYVSGLASSYDARERELNMLRARLVQSGDVR